MRKNRALQEFTQHLLFWVPTQETITVHKFGLKVVVTEEGSIVSNAKQKQAVANGIAKAREEEVGSLKCEHVQTFRMSITASSEIF